MPEKKIIPAETLDGRGVRLEPLSLDHVDRLCDAVRDGQLWQLHVTSVPHPNDMAAFVTSALEAHAAGDGLAYATIDKTSGKLAGSSRFLNANFVYQRVEIWYTVNCCRLP